MRKVKEGVMPGRSVLTFDLHLRASGIISRNDVSKHGRISFHLKLLDSVSEKGLDFFFRLRTRLSHGENEENATPKFGLAL